MRGYNNPLSNLISDKVPLYSADFMAQLTPTGSRDVGQSTSSTTYALEGLDCT